MVIGEKFQIESKVLAETRTYVVQTPDYYKERTDAYPVLVLLDAENNFAYTSGAVHLLSANGRIPAMLIVGINNTDRSRGHDSLQACLWIWRHAVERLGRGSGQIPRPSLPMSLCPRSTAIIEPVLIACWSGILSAVCLRFTR